MNTWLKKKLIWYPLVFLQTLQRLPYILNFFVFWFIADFCYRVTKRHGFLDFFLRWEIKLYFFLNGIWVSAPREISYLKQGVVIANYKARIEYFILWKLFSQKKFMIIPRSYFIEKTELPFMSFRVCIYIFLIDKFVKKFKEGYRSILYLFGFYPPEIFSVYDYEKKNFFVEKYLDQGFMGIESVKFSDTMQIPYLLMLAFKKQLPVYVFDFEGSEKVIFANFFLPRRVKVKYLGKIEPQEKLVLYKEKYDALINAKY